jgi:hypothetical protein
MNLREKRGKEAVAIHPKNESANWRMSEGSLRLKRSVQRLASKGEPAPFHGRKCIMLKFNTLHL